MKTILICKDCLSGQKDSLPQYKNNSEVNLFFTECMGVCPTGKISIIELNNDTTNSMKPESKTMSQITGLLSSKK